MSFLSNSPNHVLASLPPHELDLLQDHLRHVELRQGTILHNPQDPIEQTYFPDAGVISLVVLLSTGQSVEAGVIGRNGVIGAAAAMDGQFALNQAIVQVAGSAYVIKSEVLKRLVNESATLRAVFVNNEQAIFAQTQQVAACNAVHHLEERLCRWLLQTRDLIRNDTLPLTQEFLSIMLAVQRSSVTLVARKLQEGGLIRYRRGHIQIIDLEGLEDSSCECYATINRQFERLTGWRPDGDGKIALPT